MAKKTLKTRRTAKAAVTQPPLTPHQAQAIQSSFNTNFPRLSQHTQEIQTLINLASIQNGRMSLDPKTIAALIATLESSHNLFLNVFARLTEIKRLTEHGTNAPLMRNKESALKEINLHLTQIPELENSIPHLTRVDLILKGTI